LINIKLYQESLLSGATVDVPSKYEQFVSNSVESLIKKADIIRDVDHGANVPDCRFRMNKSSAS